MNPWPGCTSNTAPASLGPLLAIPMPPSAIPSFWICWPTASSGRPVACINSALFGRWAPAPPASQRQRRDVFIATAPEKPSQPRRGGMGFRGKANLRSRGCSEGWYICNPPRQRTSDVCRSPTLPFRMAKGWGEAVPSIFPAPSQHQRCCVIQPKVGARHERLPWVTKKKISQPRRRLWQTRPRA